MPIAQKAQERRHDKLGKVDLLMLHLKQDEAAAFLRVLQNTEAYSTTDVQMILRDESLDPERDPDVPDDLYDISERTIGRWRKFNLPTMVRGL